MKSAPLSHAAPKAFPQAGIIALSFLLVGRTSLPAADLNAQIQPFNTSGIKSFDVSRVPDFNTSGVQQGKPAKRFDIPARPASSKAQFVTGLSSQRQVQYSNPSVTEQSATVAYGVKPLANPTPEIQLAAVKELKPSTAPDFTISAVKDFDTSAIPDFDTSGVKAPKPVKSFEIVFPLDKETAANRLSVRPRALSPEIQPGFSQRPQVSQRTYDRSRNGVVVAHDQGKREELSYVSLPILFVVNTAELLDRQSYLNLESMARVVTQILDREPNARFQIEGHTSTDGPDEANLLLSRRRAVRIKAELTHRFGVPATALHAIGYGESYPAFPYGSEEQRQLDRRVLIVRTE